MKRIIIFCVSLVIITTGLNAQCRKKASITKSEFVVAVEQKCGFATRDETETSYLCLVWDGMQRTVCAKFVKFHDNYYLYFDVLFSFSEKFYFLSSNPLKIFLENNEILTLYPCGDAKGRFSGTDGYGVECFYKLNRTDLEKLGSKEISYYQFFYTADEMIARSQKDNEGNFYAEFKQKQGKSPNFIMKAANCMLNK
jgi:hypothetical protein